jgi:hypothetical protein
MVYADYGVGKTTLAASADDVPEMTPVLYVDAEAGQLSLANRPKLHRVRVTTWRQISAVYEFLKALCRAREDNDLDMRAKLFTEVMPGREPVWYKSVVIDSLSEAYKYLVYQISGIRPEHQIHNDMPAMQWQQWGAASEMCRLMVRRFRDLPMHTTFVASVQTKEDDQKRQLRSPNFPGKLSFELQAFPDVVGFYVQTTGEEGQIVRRLNVSPGRTFQAKNRFVGQQVSVLLNPTMKDLMDLAKKSAEVVSS